MTALLQLVATLGMLVVGVALVVGAAFLIVGVAATVRSYWWL